jgi:hypothetical protein
MATFHTVYVISPREGPVTGWAVERRSFDDPTVLVSSVYRDIGNADLEAKRLTKIEASPHA